LSLLRFIPTMPASVGDAQLTRNMGVSPAVLAIEIKRPLHTLYLDALNI
jgi:hypothetical protein